MDFSTRRRSRCAAVLSSLLAGAVPAGAALAAALLGAAPALAQGTAVLTGTIVDAETKRPLADAVVTARSSSLQGEQLVVTDASGTYRIPNLPPGEYTLSVDRDAYRPYARAGVPLRTSSTIRLNVELLPEALSAEEIVVVVQESTIDLGSSSTGVTLGQDFTGRLPLIAPAGKGAASRSLEGLALVAPGAQPDQYGVSINGATSPESAFIIDGLSVNDPAYGSLGTPLSVEFVKEANVITGGYMPEYGRSTGGILDVVTKSGSNDLHGSVFFNITPGALEGPREAVRQEGTIISTDPFLSSLHDFGGEVGGPILKDKLWFYAGVDIAFTRYRLERNLNQFVLSPDGTPQRDETGFSETTRIPGTTTIYYADQRSIQYLGKLTYSIDPDNSLTLSIYGTPTTSGGDGAFGYDSSGQVEVTNIIGPYGAHAHRFVSSASDVSLKYSSAFDNKRLLLDVLGGWHHQRVATLPADGSELGTQDGLAGTDHVVYRRSSPSPRSIRDFERVPAGYCAPVSVPNPDDPDSPTLVPTCPVTGYELGGPGRISDAALNRYQVKAKLTSIVSALGHHVVKGGVDVAIMDYYDTRALSGGVQLRESADGTSFHDQLQSAYLTGPDQPVIRTKLEVDSHSTEIGAFLQDSWQILDWVTLNAGVRYDAQIFADYEGDVVMTLPTEWSPRVGAIYDLTQSGRSKIYASFARYYESVPLTLVNGAFAPPGGAASDHDAASCDPRSVEQQRDQCRRASNLLPLQPPYSPSRFWRGGGNRVPVDPDLAPQSSDEIVLGAEVEVLPGTVAGASYTKRYINKVIEDLSRDDGNTYFIGNPGYGIAEAFPKAERDYDALNVYVQKVFSDLWLAQASYTLSYLRGNYAGLFRPETGQFIPNINSDFDLLTLLPNRDGPLPGDSTHQIKVYAAKDFPLPGGMEVQLGLAFRTRSGTPQSYLGSHPTYGLNETFILPRGAAGRGPWVHNIDAHLGYGLKLTRDSALTVAMDVFNVFNLQAATRLDETYTSVDVLPIPDGKESDLGTKIRRSNGEPFDPATKNPNFGNPLEYQPPREFRLGAKVTF
jgi:hypothetical protein